MQNYKLFIRSMRVMGKKRFVYLGSIFVMSVTFALFGIMSSLLMKCVVDIAQTGEYERLGYSIVAIVVVGVISLLIYRVATIRYNVEAKRVYGDLSERVLDAEMSLPYSYYEKHHSGDDDDGTDNDQRGLQAAAHTFFDRLALCDRCFGALRFALFLFAGCAHSGSFLS